MGTILILFQYAFTAFMIIILFAFLATWIADACIYVKSMLDESERLKNERQEAKEWAIKDAQRRSYENWKAKNYIKDTGDVDLDKLHRHMDKKIKPPSRGNIDFEIT